VDGRRRVGNCTVRSLHGGYSRGSRDPAALRHTGAFPTAELLATDAELQDILRRLLSGACPEDLLDSSLRRLTPS
jgi:hypothetical protein